MAGLEQPDEGRMESRRDDQDRIPGTGKELPIKDSNQRVIDYVKEIGEYVQTRADAVNQCVADAGAVPVYKPDMQYTPDFQTLRWRKRKLYRCPKGSAGPMYRFLDEPSNDVDIRTVTILEYHLNAFSGIVITVSLTLGIFLDNALDRSIFEFDGTDLCVSTQGGSSRTISGKQEDLEDRIRYPACAGWRKEKKERDLPERTGSRTDWTKLKFTYED